MFNVYEWVGAAVSLFVSATMFAQAGPAERIIEEDFASNPAARGWETQGATNLFLWKAAEQNLEVSWDSSFPNSYFRLPLGTIVNHEDDFSVTLDLELHDIRIGVRPEYPGTFQIAFGFQNRADADKSAFIRGTAADTPNLVEFNFLPDSGFGATVWPAMFTTNGALNYSGNDDFGIFDLPMGVPMEISLRYTASNHTAAITIRTNGVLVGQVTDAPLVDIEKGFFLDAFTISSYSDAGQDPSYPGSVLAHGTFDNIEIAAPQLAVRSATGRLLAGRWEHTFLSQSRFSYVLEASADLENWSDASSEIDGTGAIVKLESTDLSQRKHQFFRVKATRKR